MVILSDDDSGTLYGCLELAKRIRDAGKLPVRVCNFHDAPAMKLRGTCIGMQKTYILPGRHVYEYPIHAGIVPVVLRQTLWRSIWIFSSPTG